MSSDHFWGVNSYFCANFIIKIASVILGKTPPKATEWGWAPPGPPPPYGKSPQFCDFFLGRASLRQILTFFSGQLNMVALIFLSARSSNMILKTLQISQVPGGGQQERRIGGGFMQKPERPQNSAWLQLQYHATYLLLWYHAISAMISYSASKDIVSQT